MIWAADRLGENGVTFGQGSKRFFWRSSKSGHVGMIQRHIGKESERTTTKSGAPRWRSKSGVVETTQTYGSPSGTAQHHTVVGERGRACVR